MRLEGQLEKCFRKLITNKDQAWPIQLKHRYIKGLDLAIPTHSDIVRRWAPKKNPVLTVSGS